MATHETIEDWIRSENAGNASVHDQVMVAKWFWNQRITTLKDRRVRTSKVEDRVGPQLDHNVRTILDNLATIGVIEQIKPRGSGRYIRHHRSGQNFYDPTSRDFVPYLKEDLSRLLEDIRASRKADGPTPDGGVEAALQSETEDDQSLTLRAIAAVTLDVSEDEVVSSLSDPEDPIVQMNRYDKVVKAIKETDQVSRTREYDEMGWRNMALRWTLTELGEAVQANESLPV